MFGMGGSEILVILIIALLFLGPDKLPDAAKKISQGIRDLKKQGRVLQQTIEDDEHIGGAIRDLRSALRGDELPVRPRPKPKLPAAEVAAEAVVAAEPAVVATEPAVVATEPALTLPATAGEHDPGAYDESGCEELRAMIKPATGTVAQAAPEPKKVTNA